MIKFGITERGDAGLDLSWAKKLDSVDAVILITKSLNNNFIRTAMSAKERVIIHATCTGYGGTILEPYVKEKEWTYNQMKALFSMGFPPEQVVLRIDPIIPTEKGITVACNVLDLFSDLPVKRVRYSFLDMYPHVRDRFREAKIKRPYGEDQFTASAEMQRNAVNALNRYFNRYILESCAEYTPHQLGCISARDLRILDIQEELTAPARRIRKGCICPAGKTELLDSRAQCPHGCLYCYWKN